MTPPKTFYSTGNVHMLQDPLKLLMSRNSGEKLYIKSTRSSNQIIQLKPIARVTKSSTKNRKTIQNVQIGKFSFGF